MKCWMKCWINLCLVSPHSCRGEETVQNAKTFANNYSPTHQCFVLITAMRKQIAYSRCDEANVGLRVFWERQFSCMVRASTPHKSHQNPPNYSVYSKREHKLPFLVFVHFVPWWCRPCSRCRPWRCPRRSALRWSPQRCLWRREHVRHDENGAQIYFCAKL